MKSKNVTEEYRGAKAMKFLTFSFKNEAIWMAIFAFGPVVAATFILLLVYLVRFLK